MTDVSKQVNNAVQSKDLKQVAKGAGMINANKLMSESSETKSFAENLAELQQNDQDTQSLRDMVKQDPKSKIKQEVVSSTNATLKKAVVNPEQKIATGAQEAIKEQQKQTLQSAEAQDAEDLAGKHKTSEAAMADASQANQKQVNDAIKEGNVDEQRAREEEANSRKQQLANWQELAPTIVEDIKNRAVRIDIPGLTDVETLIVRMKSANAVDIQAVGSKAAMDMLRNAKGALGARFAKHGMKVNDLKTFFSGDVNKEGNA